MRKLKTLEYFFNFTFWKKRGRREKLEITRKDLKTTNEKPNTLAQVSSNRDNPMNKINEKVRRIFLLK